MKKNTNYKDQKAVHPLMTAIYKANTLEGFKSIIEPFIEVVKKDINSELIYGYYFEKTLGNYEASEFPLHYAVTWNKAFLVPYLVELGAKEVENSFLLHHAVIMDSHLESIREIYEAGFNRSYRNTLSETRSDNVFKYLHEKLYSISLLEVAQSYPSYEKYLRHLLTDSKNTGKPVFLRSIRENHDIKSALKLNFILGLPENPIVTFLRTSKTNSAITDTKSYNKLKGIIDKHQFLPADFNQWKEKLSDHIDSDEFKPNPALAALYFAFNSPDGDDYRLFEKHLMVTNKTGYTPDMKNSLDRVLSRDGLSRMELTTLKKNIKTILEFNGQSLGEIMKEITDDLQSPLRAIARTIKYSRGDKATKTYRELQRMGLFAPKPQQPQFAYVPGKVFDLQNQ